MQHSRTRSFAVWPLNSFGALDVGYGKGGFSEVFLNPGLYQTGSPSPAINTNIPITVARDGSVYAAYTSEGLQFAPLFASRIGPFGELDTFYGSQGKAVIGNSGTSSGTGGFTFLDRSVRLVVGPDDKLHMFQSYSSPSGRVSIVSRFLPTGQSDTGFATGGTFRTEDNTDAQGGTIDRAGRVVLREGAGRVGTIGLRRLTTAGQDDPSMRRRMTDSLGQVLVAAPNNDILTYGPVGFSYGSGAGFFLYRIFGEDSRNTPPTIQPSGLPRSFEGSLGTGAGSFLGSGPQAPIANLLIDDVETPPGVPSAPLAITVTSSNPDLLPNDGKGVTISVVGKSLQVGFNPTPGRSGQAVVTVTVKDVVGASASADLLVTVNPDGSGTIDRAPTPAPPSVVAPASVRAALAALGPNLRATTADLNGDGVPETIGVAGPGTESLAVVLDGRTQAVLAAFTPFESSFRGGMYVTVGDVAGTGKPYLVFTPDEGGGPVVALYDAAQVAAGNVAGAEVGRFFGIDDSNFRGGVRPAVANLSGGPALVVAAGFGGGPRVAVYDGRDVAARAAAPRRLVPDFFAFEETLRNGAFVAAGDLNGDGVSELVFGGGPGGGPRVRVIDGAGLLAAVAGGTFAGIDLLPSTARLANFFAGDTAARDGVRTAVRDAFGDGTVALATTGGAGGTVRVYRAATVLAGPAVADAEYDPVGGVFLE